MITRNALSSPARCVACTNSSLSAFLCCASTSSLAFPPRSFPRSSVKQWASPQRTFKSVSCLRSEEVVEQASGPEVARKDEPDANSKSSDVNETPTEPGSPVPWYLQVRTPQQVQSPLSYRQRLPDLPPDPPALLKPMIEHISSDLGLDDLSLIDLRRLDPPPALGANLLMLISTARSEKHLHVSADRFCRWLRTEHRLTPYADGLLGRGELKLKMRRKARRARIMSRVGSSEQGNAEDGIRTGWVCVNVGVIEEQISASDQALAIEGYVGFGSQSKGTKFVVQMLTEGKREELDLERLWSQALARQERRKNRILRDAQAAEEVRDKEVGDIITNAMRNSPDEVPLNYSHLQKPAMHILQHRSFHSTPRSLGMAKIPDGASNHLPRDVPMPVSRPRRLVPQYQPPGPVHSLRKPEQDPVESTESISLLSLQARIDSLQNMAVDDAIQALGNGIADFESTSFLRAFYAAYPRFPSTEHWILRLDLACYAVEIGHPQYSKADLMSLMGDLQASALPIDAKVYEQVVRALLHETTAQHSTVSSARDHRAMQQPPITVNDLDMALRVLEDMAVRGVGNVMSERILTSMQKAIIMIPHHDLEGLSRLHEDAHKRFNILMADHGKVSFTTSHHEAILNACADVGNWKEFWRNWHGIARRFQTRPSELYALVFHRVAESDHQAEAARVLRNVLPEMEREAIPVKLSGSVAEAVLECLIVADPNVQEDFRTSRNEHGQWVKIWEKCISGLNANRHVE